MKAHLLSCFAMASFPGLPRLLFFSFRVQYYMDAEEAALPHHALLSMKNEEQNEVGISLCSRLGKHGNKASFAMQ